MSEETEASRVYPPEQLEKYRKHCWQKKVMIDYIVEASKKYGEKKTILRSADSGHSLTYQDLLEGSRRLAAHFLEAGIKPKDVVILQLNNTPLFFQAWFALSRIGAVPLDVVPRHGVSELSVWGNITEAVGYIMPGVFRGYDYFDWAVKLKEMVPSIKLIFTSLSEERGGAISLWRLLEKEPSPYYLKKLDEIKVSPEDPDVLLLTGGTTGLPKLVQRLHAPHAYCTILMVKRYFLTPNSRLLIPLPIEYNLMWMSAVGAMIYGAAVFMTDVHRPEPLMKIIQDYRITHMVTVPALLVRIVRSPERERYDLSSLQYVISGGQAIQKEVAREVESKIGCIVRNNFGMAEGIMFAPPYDAEDEDRWAMGYPLSPFDEVKVVDPETGEEIKTPYKEGELWGRGPCSVRGYYRDPRTEEKFTKDGFCKTSDLVYFDERGIFHYVGRVQDIINRGGEKFGCEEVEGYIIAHPKVKEVGVIGIPDPELGERVCACVVPKDENDPPTLDELREFLTKMGVSWFKIPERLEIVDELPATGRGKIDRRELRRRVLAKMGKSLH
jgi:non-ribosomal peptide synthetase component E (peptide arylation enzyme)